MIRAEIKRLALGLLLTVWSAGPLAADDIDHQLTDLKRQLVLAARQSQDHEQRVTAIESQIKGLSHRQNALKDGLYGRRAAQSAHLGALMRLSWQPPQALIATPATIDNIIRTSLLLATTASLLGDEARRIAVSLDDLAVLHRRVASQRMELATATAGLAGERDRLETLLARLRDKRRDIDSNQAAARTASLAAEAESLSELSGAVLGLTTDGAVSANRGPPFSAARGSLPMPARGRLVGLFGEAVGEAENKGITIETRDHAQVITPYDGEVVYAGVFRSYGRLLIIDHGEGYHTLLAGFSRIDSEQGQWLLAGEPVGIMGRGPVGQRLLYVEFRRDGVAINPLPWLAADYKKANG